MKVKRNESQVDKVTLFKSRVGNVNSSQTTCGFSVITFFFFLRTAMSTIFSQQIPIGRFL